LGGSFKINKKLNLKNLFGKNVKKIVKNKTQSQEILINQFISFTDFFLCHKNSFFFNQKFSIRYFLNIKNILTAMYNNYIHDVM